MSPTIFSIFLVFLASTDEGGINDATSLIATIESLQHPVQDFRCEFEGMGSFKGKAAEDPSTKAQIDSDGLHQTFSGVFIWKTGGDTRSDTMNRLAVNGKIAHQIVVVRMSQNQAERYYRFDDAPLGYSVIENTKQTTSWLPDSLGSIFLIDKLKRDVANEGFDPSVTDDQIDGRPLKVLNIAIKSVPDSLSQRFWIDLRRSGHVVRRETYQKHQVTKQRVMSSRLDITLAPFQVGGTEVWMPVSGDGVGYGATEKGRPIMTDEPTVLDTIKVVDRSMEFNKHPGPEAFTIKYKPGTHVSDNLRQLTYEFGQQKIGAKPTKTELATMLNEQVAKAEEQKSELVVAPSSQGINWSSWLIGGMGAAVVASLVAVWVQRRR